MRYFHNTVFLLKAIFSYHFGLFFVGFGFFWGGAGKEAQRERGVLGFFVGVLGFLFWFELLFFLFGFGLVFVFLGFFFELLLLLFCFILKCHNNKDSDSDIRTRKR